MTGLTAGGFLSLTGPSAPRVADCRSAAMLMKSALRINLSASYGKITILLNYLPSADTPPIRLCRTSPASGGRIGFYAFLQRHGSMAKHP